MLDTDSLFADSTPARYPSHRMHHTHILREKDMGIQVHAWVQRSLHTHVHWCSIETPPAFFSVSFRACILKSFINLKADNLGLHLVVAFHNYML